MTVFSKERDRTVDAAKGLGLLLVFVGHAVEVAPGAPAKALFAAIYSFHIPLFFLLSGYVLAPALGEWRPLSATLRQVARRFFLPYVAFGSVFLGVAFLQRFGAVALTLPESYFALAIAFFQLLCGNPLPGVVIWFLYASGAVRLIAGLAAPVFRFAGVEAVAVLSAGAWLYWGFRQPEVAPYAPDLYLRPFALFGYFTLTTLGAALRTPLDALRSAPLRPSQRASLVAALALATYLVGRLNVQLPYVAAGTILEKNLFAPVIAAGYFGNPLVLLVSAVLGTAATLATADVLGSTRAGGFLAKAGERSLGVFCLNGFTLAFLNKPAVVKIAAQLGDDAAAPAMILFALLQWHAAVSIVGAYRKLRPRRARGSKQEPRPADFASRCSPPEIRASGPA